MWLLDPRLREQAALREQAGLSGSRLGPYSSAVSNDGTLAVAFGSSVVMITRDGTVEEFSFIYGKKLSPPVGLAFGPNGELAIADGHNRVVIKHPDGKIEEITSANGQKLYPKGVAFSTDGRLAITQASSVVIVHPNGKIEEITSVNNEKLMVPTRVAFSLDGRLGILAHQRVVIINLDGTIEDKHYTAKGLRDIGFTRNGRVIVTSKKGVEILPPNTSPQNHKP